MKTRCDEAKPQRHRRTDDHVPGHGALAFPAKITNFAARPNPKSPKTDQKIGAKPERFVRIHAIPNEPSYFVDTTPSNSTGIIMGHIEALPVLLTEHDVAHRLNLKVATLRRWRWSGDGPKFIKVGSAVRYVPRDLERYITSRARQSTSDSSPIVAAALLRRRLS